MFYPKQSMTNLFIIIVTERKTNLIWKFHQTRLHAGRQPTSRLGRGMPSPWIWLYVVLLIKFTRTYVKPAYDAVEGGVRLRLRAVHHVRFLLAQFVPHGDRTTGWFFRGEADGRSCPRRNSPRALFVPVTATLSTTDPPKFRCGPPLLLRPGGSRGVIAPRALRHTTSYQINSRVTVRRFHRTV